MRLGHVSSKALGLCERLFANMTFKFGLFRLLRFVLLKLISVSGILRFCWSILRHVLGVEQKLQLLFCELDIFVQLLTFDRQRRRDHPNLGHLLKLLRDLVALSEDLLKIHLDFGFICVKENKIISIKNLCAFLYRKL